MKAGKSFITVDIDATDAAKFYAQISKAFSAEKRKEYNKVGAEAANSAIQSYYLRKGRNLWINPSLPTHGPGRQKTRFSENVTGGWNVGTVTGSGARINNNAIGLAHKVTGGWITAKHSKFLTIPIIPQAHGRTAEDFKNKFGPLFASKGCLMWKKADGTIEPAFALKKAIKHDPWPNALPPDAEISDAFAKAAITAVTKELS